MRTLEEFLKDNEKIGITGNLAKLIYYRTCLQYTDYKAIKFAEGWLTEEEYAPIKAERESLREQIRQLEKGVDNE